MASRFLKRRRVLPRTGGDHPSVVPIIRIASGGGVYRQLSDIYFLNGINGIGKKCDFGGLTRFEKKVTCGHRDVARRGWQTRQAASLRF